MSSLVCCCLFLLFFNSVSTSNSLNVLATKLEYDETFSLWPSLRNGVVMMVKRKRDLMNQNQTEVKQPSSPDHSNIRGFPDEGGIDVQKFPATTTLIPLVDLNKSTVKEINGPTVTKEQPVNSTQVSLKGSTTLSAVSVNVKNITDDEETKKLTSDVLVRGTTVFGVFMLLATAYFIFYRKRNKINESPGMHNMNDTNQFRYGVLQSDDRRDNMELSHVPLTMESDDEEDEDLEIFDLGQKKKTLSYVNLQQNDEEIVFDKSRGDSADHDNVLLDIEEGPSDTLINWTNNSSNNRSLL